MIDEEDGISDEERAWIQKVMRKYNRRTGIRRYYTVNFDTRERGSRLHLEFVIWGRVFFRVTLWKVKGIFARED